MREELEIRSGVEEQTARSEWGKFGVLAGVLLGAVLVVAVLRPYIFNTVIPAIMGEGAGKPAEDMVEEPVPLLLIPMVGVEETVLPAEPAGSIEPGAVNEAGAPEVMEAYPVLQEAAVVEESGGVATAVTYIEHTVQPGENLTSIAQKHNVTIADIMAANDIPNPHRVVAGAVLRIPQP